MEEVANNPTIEEGTAAADVIDSPKPDPTPDNTVTESVDDPAPAPVEETPAQNDTSSPKEIPVTASEETTVGPIKEPEVAEPQADIDGVKSNGEVPNKGNATESASPVKKQEKIDDEFLPPESDGVIVPPHWHAKPCVHLTSIGGFVTEEELLPIFNVHGKVSSIVFESERRDTAIIRYEAAPGEGDHFVGRVRESLHNKQLGDRTLLIEGFRSDSLLFIGNLTPDIDDALLRKMFEPHGSLERAFVLHNAAGRSKGYGFVEYSLKSQAMAAKMAMGNINMDGRVLRVEWSDCKRIADMFSTVLFVDRIPKENPNVEGSLRALFGRYGKVRDCHLAIGVNNVYRGFGFIDFYHSKCADIAHEALDGHELEGHSIRVSFANPSKSAQSYKLRFGSQSSSGSFGLTGRGAFPGMMLNNSMRGHMPMPLLGHRFMGPGRSGMMGMGIGMQFGRGSHVGQALLDQGLVGNSAGMLGAGAAAAAAGMMGRAPVLNSVPPRRGMAVGGTLAPLPRFPGQGPVPINPATIAQVATAQAKAREEEAKARAEEYHQQQPQQTADNLFKQPDSQYGYQQPYQQQAQQPPTLQPQYQQAGQQTQQPYAQYYAQPAQSYIQSQQQQQPQQGQYSQSSSYYQQQSAQQEQTLPSQPYPYTQQYTQQYGQQYAHPGQQQYSQTYNPAAVQSSVQQYQQTAQPPAQTQYAQPTYTDHYVQQQNQERPQTNTAPATNAVGILASQSQDGTQQQAYTAYYNQQAQQNAPQVATVAAPTSTAVGTSQQSLEAQWAAYYASQAAYQQQAANYAQQPQQQQPPLGTSATSYHEQSTGTPDVGQKRTADQMEAGSQNQQMAYNYPQQMTASYPQQAAAGAGTYQQQQPMPATAYQQHPAAAVPGYQMQTNALPYQQQPTATGYQQPGSTAVSSAYDKPVVPVADAYQQQQPAAVAASFQPSAQGQAVAAPIYDYNKRPRF